MKSWPHLRLGGVSGVKIAPLLCTESQVSFKYRSINQREAMDLRADILVDSNTSRMKCLLDFFMVKLKWSSGT